jgi:hypothetical protein
MASVSRALQSLGFAAMAARIDSRLALEPVRPLRQLIRHYPNTRRNLVGDSVRDCVADLLAAVNEVPTGGAQLTVLSAPKRERCSPTFRLLIGMFGGAERAPKGSAMEPSPWSASGSLGQR